MDVKQELDEILNRRRKTEPAIGEVFEELFKVATKHKVSFTISVNRDGTEYSVSPWEPYQPICPYARQRCVEEDDGKRSVTNLWTRRGRNST